MTIFEHRHFTR